MIERIGMFFMVVITTMAFLVLFCYIQDKIDEYSEIKKRLEEFEENS